MIQEEKEWSGDELNGKELIKSEAKRERNMKGEAS